MVVQAPSYEAMSKPDLIQIIKTQQAEIQRFKRLIPISNKTYAPGEKLGLVVAQPLISKETPNAQGLVRLPINTIAEQTGMSACSISRHFSKMCERTGSTRKVEPYRTKSGQNINLVWVNPSEALWTAPETVILAPEQERNHGGDSTHCRCGGKLKIQKRALREQEIRTCTECGDMTIYPPYEVNQPLEPNYVPDMEALQVADLAFQADFEDDPNEPEQALQVADLAQNEALQVADLQNEEGKLEILRDLSVYTLVSELQLPPPFLRDRPIWVCWRYEPKTDPGKKPDKVPYQPHGRETRPAKSNDPKTWGSYDQAQRLYEDSVKHGFKVQYDGIGIMCDGSFTVIDLDHCIEAGTLSDQAADRIGALDSYTELSPSATGVHIIARGTIPSGRKRDDIEMYTSGRFLTWTGKHIIGTSANIEDRQEELAMLHAQITPSAAALPPIQQRTSVEASQDTADSDQDVLDKARNAGNGAKFRLLFDDGQWKKVLNERGERRYGSQSEADQGLCRMLAYWTDGNVSTIDRLFRQSKLYRPEKWDRKARAGEIYGEGTIRRALGDQQERIAS